MMRFTTVLLAVIGACATAGAEDWTQWRGEGRRGHSPSSGLLKKWPEDGPKRVGLFKRLKATPQIGWMVKLISAQEISEKMLRRSPISLNAISHDCAMELVKLALDDGAKIQKVKTSNRGVESIA